MQTYRVIILPKAEEDICSNTDYIALGDGAVDKAKKNREWRHEYMTLSMRDQENLEKGH